MITVVFKRYYPPRYEKGMVAELPDAMARELEALGVVEVRQPNEPTEFKEDA